MTESKAYEQVKLYSNGFIKFINYEPKRYYLERMRHYLAKVIGNKDKIDLAYKKNLDSLIEYLEFINNSEDGMNLKIDTPESTFLFAYMACNVAWIEAGITYKSYPSEIPARINLSQGANIGYYRKDSYGKYVKNNTNAPTFFNEMDDELLSTLSDTSMQILLGSSYYGEYPVIDVDAFNKHIHNTIESYYKDVIKISKHDIKNSSMPNKKFHEKIANGFGKFSKDLSMAVQNLDFTKENPLNY